MRRLNSGLSAHRPSQYDGVPDGSVGEVKTWVGQDVDRAEQALAAENAKPEPDKDLVSHLTDLILEG